MEDVEKENGREAVETINKNYVRRVRMNMMKKIDNEDSLMVVEGILQGANLKFVMFDTGSEISILAKRVAKANNFLIKRVKTIIELPDGRQVNALGETETLKFEVMGYYTNMSFTVTEIDEYDMLIGLNFFNKTGLGIFPGKKLLCCYDNDIRLAKRSLTKDFNCMKREVIQERESKKHKKEDAYEKSSNEKVRKMELTNKLEKNDPRLIIEKVCEQQKWQYPKYAIISSRVYEDKHLKHIARVRINGLDFYSMEACKTIRLEKQSAALEFLKCLKRRI